MAFPRKLLGPDEDVVLDLRPHWRSFLRPAVTLILAVVALVSAAVAALDDWVQVALAAVTLVALGWFTHRYLRWACTNVVLTTDRLVHRSGVLARRGMEISLERVSSMSSEQSIVGRALGWGDVIVDSGSEGGRVRLTNLNRPVHLQDEIRRNVDAKRSRVAVGQSVGERLSQLDELRRAGVVTEGEFESKRASLLDRL